ncbi:tRNA pseudouridine synthase A [Myxococcus xanthus]|uniref:tRNA pseudouridine synthase A n=1 Tax=Myxococcus xanthus TaxID=34 RepID=A0AAE6KT73_MYXXA|nr:tRNA pseudouridine(38-40) synthase TruA [Myxococcus xanthus]QDE69067.1 pseudouridine synthase [Myxococcus xanthus]QDE76343.1 pseudouridine synthase [Myxococcus xanthus]QDE83768.1 pseudouridine synthase [Myxococcus xanthus]
MLPSTSKRIPVALWIWYRGGIFRGFQRQPEGPTVQSALEEALRSVGVPATLMPSGRTDRGVHARMQVVSVRLEAGDSAESLEKRLPPWLPPGLGLCGVRRPTSFHAQWSASGKEYRYRFQLGGAVTPDWAPYALDVSAEPLFQATAVTPERLGALLRSAEGTRDFIAFHEKSSPRKPRTLESATLHELGGGLYEARLRGDGFARYQIRYLMGSALKVAAGLLPEEAWLAALETGQAMEGFKAPAHGLVLWEVRYPPGVDPFTAGERLHPPGLPLEPPFHIG